MEFWGVEVKSGVPLKVEPGGGMILHLSQASIGEVEGGKGSESVCLFVKVDGKKLVLGTLFSDKLPQQILDLVFDREFELSHNWKSGSVYFYGYRASNLDEEDDDTTDDEESDSESDEEMADLPLVNKGKPKQEKPAGIEKANAGKDSAAGKQKVKIVEPNKDVKPKEGEKDSDKDGSDEDISTDEDMAEDEDDSDSEDDDSDEDEETPKRVETGKKRAAESAIKTPIPDKKAKVATPQKTDGKKGGVHVATPHPAKQAGKTPANKSNEQTPKSHPCSSCNKSFGSESALQSHTKAKHSAGK